MTIELNADTLVSEIETEHEYFENRFGDPVQMPGKRRAKDSDTLENKLTPPQAAVIVRRMQGDPLWRDMPLGEAMDDMRSRRHANLKGRQMDFNVVNYCAYLDQQDAAGEPLTVGQQDMVDNNVKALLGTDRHFNDEVQQAIEALTKDQREAYADSLMNVSTRGELSDALRKYHYRVPDPRTTESARQSRSAQAVSEIDLDAAEDQPFE